MAFLLNEKKKFVRAVHKDVVHYYIYFNFSLLADALNVGCKDSIRMMVKNGWKEAIGNAPEGKYTDNVVFHDVFRD